VRMVTVGDADLDGRASSSEIWTPSIGVTSEEDVDMAMG
jgi:hypothetical protein